MLLFADVVALRCSRLKWNWMKMKTYGSVGDVQSAVLDGNREGVIQPLAKPPSATFRRLEINQATAENHVL